MGSKSMASRDMGRHTPLTTASSTRPQGLRVLVINDDPDVLATLQDELSASGIDVVASTTDGEDGLELARIMHPDVVLVDWDMRHFGGALTARLLRRYVPDVYPVLLVERKDLEEMTPSFPDDRFSILMRRSHPGMLGEDLRHFWREFCAESHSTGDAGSIRHR
jgi:CheY-like chemotaxis protein